MSSEHYSGEQQMADGSTIRSVSALDSSFRDPAGFLFRRDGILYRQISPMGVSDYAWLMTSGLYAELVAHDWLVAHVEVEPVSTEAMTAGAVLQPELIDFISYPYEWAFSQLQDAALLTLDVQLLALEYGMSLKDASAYNVQFRHAKPLLIDTLSFEEYHEGRPWPAYRQFCQHFLAPLALMAHTDIRLGQLLRIHIDGIPLDLASRLLPRRTRWQPGLLMHIHLHARTQRAYAATDQVRPSREVKVSRLGLTGLLQGLRNLVAKQRWQPTGTEWGEYYRATNYSDDAFAQKKRLVGECLDAVEPKSVWDLGANTGVFSRLASARGCATIAFDIDPAAVECNYRQARSEADISPQPLLPLLQDLTNPSPALGWNLAERDSLAARGPVDCVMALALIHHLAISNNIPLPRIAGFLARLGRHLIIEFVPKSDSQVQRLLRSRPDIFDDYDRAGFEAAFRPFFETLRVENVHGSERTLYLFKSRI